MLHRITLLPGRCNPRTVGDRLGYRLTRAPGRFTRMTYSCGDSLAEFRQVQ
jgi:hypothetical protein